MENKTNTIKTKEMLRLLELNKELGITETFIADYKKLAGYFDSKKGLLIRYGIINSLLCVLLAVLGALLKILFPDFIIAVFIIFMCISATVLFTYFFKLFSFLNNYREYKEILERLESKRMEKIESIKNYPHS